MLRMDGQTPCRVHFGFALWIVDGTALELPQDVSPASVCGVMDCHGVSWCALSQRSPHLYTPCHSLYITSSFHNECIIHDTFLLLSITSDLYVHL